MSNYTAADMTTAAANGHRDGYQAGYADAVKAFDAAQPAAAQEAVAWFTDDHLSDKSATTYDASVAERWRAKGWPVTPLYAAPVAAAPVVDGRDVRAAIAGIEGSVAVGSDGEWVSVRRTARDAAVTALRNLSSDCAHIYAAYAEAKASTPAAPVDDGMLPDALVPYSKEWYTLCERRFAVDKIKISGDLACAIVDAISARASAPATPGINLAQFKDLIGFAAWSAINLPETDPRRDFIRQASELLALIDASPKGGSDAKDAARYRYHRDRGLTFVERNEYCAYRVTKTGDAADTATDAAIQATSAEVGE